MQAKKLYYYKKQKAFFGKIIRKKILQILQNTYGAQGNKIKILIGQ
jgi:hypothetical protein